MSLPPLVCKVLGLPVPVKLIRDVGAWRPTMLAETVTSLYTTSENANPSVLSDQLKELGSTLDNNSKKHTSAVVSLLADTTSKNNVSDVLTQTFSSFQKALSTLERNGSLLVVSPTLPTTHTMALNAMARSLAKEIGPKGQRVNILYVPSNASTSLHGSLAYLLGRKSAFVTGQVFQMQEGGPSLGAKGLVQLHKGKRVLVTGAARGLGKAISDSFALEGADVIRVDRSAGDSKDNITIADIGSTQGRDALIRSLSGPVDVVVHNAGITRDKTLNKMKPEQWNEVMNVNMDSIFALNETLPFSSKAAIVHISSTSGTAGNFGQTNYAAAKGALIGRTYEMVKSNPSRHVVSIQPGFIETEMTKKVPYVMSVIASRAAALLQMGSPQDIANGVVFFSSEYGKPFRGETIRICGGNAVGQ